jgi:hypothetical protein
LAIAGYGEAGNSAAAPEPAGFRENVRDRWGPFIMHTAACLYRYADGCTIRPPSSCHPKLDHGGRIMRKLMLLCCCLCAMAYVAGASPAHAGNSVTYISSSGMDTNDCATPATACANFDIALSKTNNYGEIDCVGTGDFSGAFGISQSVTIDCAGAVGSILGGIQISQRDIVVRLRNLSFNGGGYGFFAIDAQTMAALYVENCVITNYNAANSTQAPYIGIKFEPTTNAQLFVSNSVISDNGASVGSLSGGIYVVPGPGVTATVSIDHSQINGNYFGVVGDGRPGGTIGALIKDSVVSGNTENGITAISSGSSVVFTIDQTAVSGNLAGLFAGGSNAGMLVDNTSVFKNTVGLDAAGGGTLFTYGNNRVNGNTTNGAFTGTAALQ